MSGLNVSIVGGLVYFLLRALRLPRKINAAVSLVFIVFYSLLAGYNAPVLRAGIMGVILMGGLLMDRETDLLSSLAVAFFALLFFKPQNLFSAGFQLSFLSVLAIFLLTPAVDERWRPPANGVLRFYRDILLAGVAATLGTFPLILYYFRIISLIGVFANLVMVPLVNVATFSGFFILPFIFLPFPRPDIPALLPCAAVKATLFCAHALARVPFAALYVPSPPVLLLWLYYAGLLALVFWPRAWKASLNSPWIMGALFVAALAAGSLAYAGSVETAVKIHLLSLRSGRAALIELPGGRESILVNTGKGNPQEEWKWAVKPFLMSRGIQRISAIVTTSYSRRDTGGLLRLAETFRARRILAPEPGKPERSEAARLAREIPRGAEFSFMRPGETIKTRSGLGLEWIKSPDCAGIRVSYGQNKLLLASEGTCLDQDVFRLGPVSRAVTLRLTGRKSRVESFPCR